MMVGQQMSGRYMLVLTVALVYAFLYIPIAVLVLNSFNASPFPYVWKGFTLAWYTELFESVEVWNAVYNSLLVAFSTVFLSIVLGTLTVFYGERTFLRHFYNLFYGSLGMPEIVLAVGLLSLFVSFGVPLGITSLIAGHTLLGLGYVVPIVSDRYAEIDPTIAQASRDLGATRGQTFFKVIIPLLKSSLLASSLLVFIVSLDDFVISFFIAGPTTQTLPMYIYSVIRSGATPVVNALSTLLLLFSSVLVMIFTAIQLRKTDGLR